MPRDGRKQSEDALFERLYDALGEQGVDDTASLRTSLRESGVDVEKVLSHGRELFANFLRRQKLSEARTALERARAAVREFRRSAGESIQGAREELARALTGETSGERFLAYHRKLERVNAEDLESLKDDAVLLEFVKRLQSESEE